METYIKYAEHIGADEFIIKWVKTTLKNYCEKNQTTTEEVEHVLDFLVMEKRKVSKMSYEQAKKLSDAWLKTQIKKGNDIEEKPEDTKVVLDFKDGFKIVQLIGQNAYKREGFLMSHCVASYFGKDVEVYSLRDKENMPHCTMEKDQQIKGKGNGDIHPKYISYVVKFLEHTGMTVGDSEMKHLGYVNIEKLIEHIDLKSVEKYIYNKKYFQKDKKSELKDKEGNELNNLDMLEVFDLVEETENSLKISFDIYKLVSGSIEWIKKGIKSKIKDEKIKSGGDFSQLAGGDSSKLAGGDSSQLAGGDSSQLAGGNSSKLAGGYSSQLAMDKQCLAIGDHNSHFKGKIGSVVCIVERNNKYEIVNYKATQIDGKIIKEDTWYKLEKGEFIEVK